MLRDCGDEEEDLQGLFEAVAALCIVYKEDLQAVRRTFYSFSSLYIIHTVHLLYIALLYVHIFTHILSNCP